MPIKVQDQSSEVKEMAQHWPIAEALMGGTAEMRKAGKAYLPMWPNEDPESYAHRLGTATLFNAFGRTIGVMAGKPFSKRLTFGEDVPEQIKEWSENIDMQGNNLHVFLQNIAVECLAYGICGVLVDFPKKPEDVKSQADEMKLGLRPYFTFIRHGQILGWQKEINNGVTRLTQLRIAESAEEPDGDWGTAEKNRVRVLFPGGYRLYEQSELDQSRYDLIDKGVTTLNEIPFVPYFGRKCEFMEGISPLLDLAYLNVKHWQSQSDQDTIMHVARVPILAIIGAEQSLEGQSGTKITVGAKSAVELPTNADMKYIEHTGAAIDSGVKSLEALEHQMVATGAEMLAVDILQKSATQSNNEVEANKSELQKFAEALEDGADQCLQLMADWVKVPKGGHITLFKDFASGSLTDASAQLIVSMQQAGLITKATAIHEQQRRGMLSPDLDAQEELDAITAEGPAPGTLV